MPIHEFGEPLTPADFRVLEDSGIPQNLAEQNGLRRVDSLTGSEMVGRNGSSGDYSGIIFPYIWPDEDHPREYRLRRDHPDLEVDGNGKTKQKCKYVSPPGRGNILYLPRDTAQAWLADVSLPVVLTEGEKKTLALASLAWFDLGDTAEKPRFLPIGLSGVWNWRGMVGKQDGPHGERQDVKGVIPDFDRIVWTKRTVTICFDADVRINESVRSARVSLAKELRRRGAHVLFVDLPEDDPKVNGVDDYIGQHGPERALALLTTHITRRQRKPPTFL